MHRAPMVALSALMSSDASDCSCGRGGAMAGGDEFSGSVARLVRARNRCGRERDLEQVLTWSRRSWSSGSGAT